MTYQKVYLSAVNPNIQYIDSMYIESEDEYSLYSNEEYKRDSSDYTYEWSNKTWNRDDRYDVNRVSELFARNSLYTEIDYNNNNDDDNNEDLNPIIDLYAQSYEDQHEYDTSEIEPVMSLPLSPRQYMLMKQKWNKQLDMELCKASLKQNQKMVSWSGFSDNSYSDNCYNSDEEYPNVPRNSQVSNLSDKSKKSTRSWKSFFSKFSKKKKQIKFYDDLLQK
jgi:hypothetical protein